MGRLIDGDELLRHKTWINGPNGDSIYDVVFCDEIEEAPTVEAIPKVNVYKAIQEMMKYEKEGFINISLVKLDEILKKCEVSEDGNVD